MDYQKIRKALIVLLSITNLIMLLNFSTVLYNQNKIENSMALNKVEYLKQKNIIIDEKLLLNEMEIFERYIYSKISQTNIEGILEKVNSNDNNLFVSQHGTAKIDTNGDFVINLTEVYEDEYMQQILLDAGFDILNTNKENSKNVTKYTFEINGMKVENCFFEVVQINNSTNIIGNFVFSQPKIEYTKDEKDVFLAIVELGNKYNLQGEITKITKEYRMISEEIHAISPFWCIYINDEIYYYDIFGGWYLIF